MSWFPDGKYTTGGNFYGYAIMIQRVKEHLEKLGVTFSARSKTAFNICAPHIIEPSPGKTNVIYTMYETDDLSEEPAARLQFADVLIVPSEFCRKSFRKYTDKPIYVVPLGVEEIPYKPITLDPSKPFRFLWVGAWNARKGWVAIGNVWDSYFKQFDYLELYLKTTTHADELSTKFRKGNCIIDGRNISREEMIELYHSANCFIFPTMGEGWGQTAAESMMAGVPLITCDYSGVKEFANKRNCYFTPYEIMRMEASLGSPSTAPDGKFAFAIASLPGLAQTMAKVLNDYDNALITAKQAAKDIRKFTWERCAQGVIDVLKKA